MRRNRGRKMHENAKKCRECGRISKKDFTKDKQICNSCKEKGK